MCRRFNCCIFNHPCPIFCPCSLVCTGNEVVNPVIVNQYGFFNNTAVGAITSQSIIPVSFVQGNDSSITGTPSGAVSLVAGTYEVSYFAEGSVPTNGTMSIKLRINGVDVNGSNLIGTQTVGNFISMTQSMIITVPQNSILELVNNSIDTTTYSIASMLIKRL